MFWWLLVLCSSNERFSRAYSVQCTVLMYLCSRVATYTWFVSWFWLCSFPHIIPISTNPKNCCHLYSFQNGGKRMMAFLEVVVVVQSQKVLELRRIKNTILWWASPSIRVSNYHFFFHIDSSEGSWCWPCGSPSPSVLLTPDLASKVCSITPKTHLKNTYWWGL